MRVLQLFRDSSETFNIDRGTESQFDALIVKQRNTPRTANWYYASCWVIGSHLTDTLTSRRTLQRSPLAIRSTVTAASMICPRRATTRNQALPEMYAIRIERKPGFTSRPVTVSEQVPIS